MLPAPERLRANRDFQDVYKAGRSFSDDKVVLYFLRHPDPAVRQAGFSVSKKLGNAVVRNRTKRRLRAIYAGFLKEVPGGYRAVFIARKGAPQASYEQLASSLRTLLVRAGAFRVDGP